MFNQKLHSLQIEILASADDPPKEFRIFRQGINTTLKGDFLFDE